MHLWCLYSGYSARSRVRGHLEIYHAYIRDGSSTAPTAEAESTEDLPNERDWEFIHNYATENSAEVINLNFCLLFDNS